MRLSGTLAIVLVFFTTTAVANAADCVILLHGLTRTSRSMAVMEKALTQEGYRVVNVNYPSRNKPVEELSASAIETGLVRCALKPGESVHFVTHSMGGILVRHYLAHHKIAALGKVVMLGPPNSGSEVVDRLKDVPAFDLINGPAGSQLGTGQKDIPAQLGPVTYPVGIIAGTQSVNLVLSKFLPNPDDGKVSVERTKVQGMTDFIAIKATHPFIMRNKEAIRQTLKFLKMGAFDHGR